LFCLTIPQQVFSGYERQTARRDVPENQSLGMENMDRQTGKTTGWSWWYLLFVVQVIAVVWPPFYNKVEPTWAGIPFFYWYQMLWVIIGAILTAIVYFATDKDHY
jgi:hypothetical protein